MDNKSKDEYYKNLNAAQEEVRRYVKLLKDKKPKKKTYIKGVEIK